MSNVREIISDLEEDESEDLVRKIISDLEENKTEELVIKNLESLLDTEFVDLITLFLRNNFIKKITLNGGVKSPQLISLINVITFNPDLKIEELNLSMCFFKDKSVARLTSLLSIKPITCLLLKDCDLNENHGVVLAEALATNNTLRFLNIRENFLKDQGACAIVKALEQNTSITDLRIDANLITDKTILAIAHLLKSNMTLKTLYLADLVPDKMSTDTAEKLAIALSYNVTLTKLSFFRLSEELKKINEEKIQPQIKINADIQRALNENGLHGIISQLLRSKNCPAPHYLEPLSLLSIVLIEVRKHIDSIQLPDGATLETVLPDTLYQTLMAPKITLARVGLFDRARNIDPNNNNVADHINDDQMTVWQLDAR